MIIDLRESGADDRESVIALDAVALADLEVPRLPENFNDLENIESEFLSNGAFVVAESDRGIVGMGGIKFMPQGTARIKRMRVHPDSQRLGIGRAILTWLEQRATEAGVGKIVLNTLSVQTGAQQLYDAFGYEQTGAGAPDWVRGDHVRERSQP